MSARRKRRARRAAGRRARWWAALDSLAGTRRGCVDRRRGAPSTRVALIGRDVARFPIRLRTRSSVPVVVAVLAGGLFLAILRMDVIRLRFAVAESFEQELRLEEQKRRLTVEMRQLREPAELSRRASELGFRRAEKLIDLRGDEDPRSAPLRPSGSLAEPIELVSATVVLDGTVPGKAR